MVLDGKADKKVRGLVELAMLASVICSFNILSSRWLDEVV
jgi:hypothetical protein